MIYHNLKIAVRNLLKYKLQTIISVLSIAIGIVTLAFTHAALSRVKFPLIYSQPYYDRTYTISLSKPDNGNPATDSTGRDKQKPVTFTPDIVRALKRDGGLSSAEQLVVPNGVMDGKIMDWHLCDSTVRRHALFYTLIDPDYPSFMGLRSALTGEVIKRLEPGEAIISQYKASVVFGKANPVGAVWPKTGTRHPLPLTIVDVYDNLSVFDNPLDNQVLYYCLGELDSDLHGAQNVENITYTVWIDVVLKEGSTLQQLQQEADARLEPFGLKVTLEKKGKQLPLARVVLINSLAYLVGGLILLAALIGFLRMEVQLFWMRRRELSLRITHGAKRMQLFGLLFTEITLVMGLSIIVAILMGNWLELFISDRFFQIVDNGQFAIQHLVPYSLCIGGGVLVLCSLIICSVLRKISKTTQGLAGSMRRSHTHLFRNIMLGLQITVAMIFVCGTLCIVRWNEMMMDSFGLSEHLDTYRETLLLQTTGAKDAPLLLTEISHLPSLDKLIAHDHSYIKVVEIEECPVAKVAFKGPYKFFYAVRDTTLLDYYRLPVRWFKKPSDKVEGLLLNDSLYQQLRSMELATNNMLTVQWSFVSHTLPILGTIPQVPYQHDQTSLVVHPDVFLPSEFLLIPKVGQYQSLLREVTALLDRLVPIRLPRMVQNFHASHGEILILESLSKAVWILCTISIIVCAMGIYSTIALDTRSRRKEMAIRKINGAKSRDIYRLFGRIYLLLIVLSLFIAMPVTDIFHQILFSPDINGMKPDAADSALWACIGGALLVIAMIAAIVLSNVRSIMRTNPSEIIAKE